MPHRPHRLPEALIASTLRKTGFALVVSALLLLAMEGGARTVEGLAPAQEAILPSPRGASCAACVPGAQPPTRGAAPVRLVWSETTGTWRAVEPGAPNRPELPELRGPAPAVPRDPAELRILTLGDSSVWGHGVAVEQVFSTRAAAALSEGLGRPVTAFIGAQPGHTARQSGATLAALGERVDPDLVLIANLWSDLFHPDAPARLRPPGAHSPSALYRVLLRILGPWLPTRTVTWIDPETGRGLPADGRIAQTPLPDYRAQLDRLAAEARALGAKPAFLALPAPLDLSGAVPPIVTDYRDAMRQVAHDHGAPLVDGPAAFARQGATEAWFLDAVHPSEAGHAALGAAVSDAILADPRAWALPPR